MLLQSVTAIVSGVTSNNDVKFSYAATINSFSPTSGPPGTLVTFYGQFGVSTLNSASVGGVVCGTVAELSTPTLTTMTGCTVPTVEASLAAGMGRYSRACACNSLTLLCILR